MALSLQECIEKIKKAQPDLYPVWYIEEKGTYMFNLLKRGVNKEEALSNFYVVDSKTGKIVGPIPVMSVYENEALTDKLMHPHMISGEDQQSVKHEEPASSSYWGVSRSDDEFFLSHHGIIGQKWGVRRFQNDDGTLTAAGKERYSKGSSDSDKKTEKEESKEKLTLKEKWLLKDAQHTDKMLASMDEELNVDREKTKKNDTSKKVVFDVALTVLDPARVPFLIADGSMAIYAKHKLSKYMKNREQNSERDEKTGLYMKKDGEYDEKQDLAAVNPGFYDLNSNTKNNCMLCTTTYDMRQRGYDVTAQLDSYGYNFADIKRWYPKATVNKIDRYDENGKGLNRKDYAKKTLNELLKQGDGARGNFMLCWIGGGAHSIVYEVQNGKVVFKDGQANKIYSNEKSALSSYTPEKLLNMSSANAYVRLDNVKPDLEKIIKECVR